MVPRVRTRASPIWEARNARAGMAPATTSDAATAAGLAAALHAQRIVRARRHRGVDVETGQVVGARHAVVHERAGHELAGIVVDAVLEQRLADALGDAAVHLALDDHRVDDLAEVVD